MTTIDHPTLRTALTGIISDALTDIAEGTAEDLARYAELIANDAATYIATGNEARLEEVTQQALVLAEVNRIRVDRAGQAAFLRTVSAIVRTGVAVVSAALTGGSR